MNILIKKSVKPIILGVSFYLSIQSALAGVPQVEADKLGVTLTPLGAQMAGNEKGTIPAWTGCSDLNAPLEQLKSGDRRWNPYPDEKPMYVVTKANMAEYDSVITDGMKALLDKFSDMSFPVYATHRNHCAPDDVYKATKLNAVNGKLVGDAYNSGVEGAINGIPFPIPSNGLEAKWNMNMRWRGRSFETLTRHVSWTSSGQKVLGTQAMQFDQLEFYRPGQTLDEHAKTGYLDWMFYQKANAPSFRAGEGLVTRGQSNYAKKSVRDTWQYLLGQRRVRRAPSVGWDTPDFIVSGTDFFDEVFGGPITPKERFTYKLIGKKELLIPYNNNILFSMDEDEIFVGTHHNPKAIRWELHRVWVVEATLADGQRHAVPRRMHYIDEDTWGTSLMDGYDGEGKIWRVSINPAYYLPDMPGMMSAYSDILYVLDGDISTRNLVMPNFNYQMKFVPVKDQDVFTPDYLANESDR